MLVKLFTKRGRDERNTRQVLKKLLIILMSFAFAVSVFAEQSATTAKATAETLKLKAIIDADHRAKAQKARDQYRRPLETLSWFGLKENMTVVEVFPGGGWYTEIIAPFVNDSGKYYGAGYDAESPVEFFRKGAQRFKEKLAANPDIYGNAVVTELGPPKKLTISPANSADMVLTFRNVHNWMASGTADHVFAAMYAALKPGGILGLVEHRGNPEVAQDPKAKSGYVNEDYVIALATKAGFQWVEKSQINANPKDTKDYPEGVWTLPPTLKLKEKDREKYLAIGESDRMTLKFVKPTEDDIVRQCRYQNIGDNQRAQLTIINRNKDGKEKRSVYRRYVKNYRGKDNLLEKMLLFAEFPPESRGLAFMRWEYLPDSGQVPDQWLYSPSLRNVRRVSMRDASERFLGSTLTLGDIGLRSVQRDTHRLLGGARQGNLTKYVIESVPKSADDMYSKRIVEYVKGVNWETCLPWSIEYHDNKGFKLKLQTNRWQRVEDAWVWQQVVVKNFQTNEVSVFQVHDVVLDIDLEDDMFNERTLRRGLK